MFSILCMDRVRYQENKTSAPKEAWKSVQLVAHRTDSYTSNNLTNMIYIGELVYVKYYHATSPPPR